MPLPDLIQAIQNTTLTLASAIAETARNEAAYQRRFWSTWQKVPEDWSIAAANRACEQDCSALDEERILSRALVESLTVRRDSMIAIMRARTP